MSDAPLMVGVSGLRGIVGKSLTPEVAARFAGAVGTWLVRERGAKKRPKVVIGQDGRRGSEMIVAAAASGLLASGCDVVSAGIAMTPTLGVLVDSMRCDAGLQVTASHNPQEWNGLKVLLPAAGAKRGVSACAPSKEIAAEMVSLFQNGAPGASWDGLGSGEWASGDDWQSHWELVVQEIGRLKLSRLIKSRSFKVSLDSVGGSGGRWTEKFLDRELGCKVSASGTYKDGLFTHAPEPTRENLAGFCKLVKKAKSQVGFAQDPDADRLAIVDERGKYIGEEYTLALAAEALLSVAKPGRKQRVLVTNLSTSRMLDDVAARHGARVVRTAVGEANVVEAMKREAAAGHDVVVGGEGNGGVIWPRVTYVRDSLSAMALVLSLMARRKQKLSEIVASMPAYAIEKRKVELARREDANPAVEKLSTAYAQHQIDLQDGVRVDFSSGDLAGKAWLHVRASNTEPIMRLIAEAPTASAAQGILDEAARVIGG